MKEWQFDVLFAVGVGGAIFLLISPLLGAEEVLNPTAMTGVGAILTFVLTQKRHIVRDDAEGDRPEDPDESEGHE